MTLLLHIGLRPSTLNALTRGISYRLMGLRLPFSLPGAVLLVALGSAGCSKAVRAVQLDLTQGRLADLALTERMTGQREFLLFSLPKRTVFLEGYISGMVTDYGGNPIQGVIVRAELKRAAPTEGQAAPEAEPASESVQAPAGAQFDPGISDARGLYRIRFSLPVIDDVVDVQGRFAYNPNWEQEKATLGRTYEPQMRESEFRLYYDSKRALAAFSDGLQKAIVQPFPPAEGKTGLPGARAPAVAAPAQPARPAPAAAAPGEDLFRGFGFGP